MKNKTCCIFGHRKIDLSDKQIKALTAQIENLVTNEKVNTFVFGSKSQFNDLCLNIVSKLKEKYPHIERIYIRAEYPFITKQYEEYLLCQYESTYFPENIINAGKARYIERNYEMVKKSDICLIYYDPNHLKPNSGTYKAYKYAEKKKRKIINTFYI